MKVILYIHSNISLLNQEQLNEIHSSKFFQYYNSNDFIISFYLACLLEKDPSILNVFISKIYEDYFNTNKKKLSFDIQNKYCKILYESAFSLACKYNKNISIIKYFFDNSLIIKNNDYVIDACIQNDNLNIIKYLIEIMSYDINYTDEEGKNAFLHACESNSNPSILLYLAREKSMNVNFLCKSKDNAFTLACRNNKNIEIIKCLINDININHYHIILDDKQKKNGLDFALKYNNPNIVYYLIECGINKSISSQIMLPLDNLKLLIDTGYNIYLKKDYYDLEYYVIEYYVKGFEYYKKKFYKNIYKIHILDLLNIEVR